MGCIESRFWYIKFWQSLIKELINGKYLLIKFTHEGHKGPVSDLNWNPY